MNEEELKAKVDYEFSHRFNHTLHAYIDISDDLIALDKRAPAPPTAAK